MRIPENYRMIAVGGTPHRLYANLLRLQIPRLVTQHDNIPDTQSFFPSRSMLQPDTSILWHLKDVAQKLHRGSSRLYTAFIDFKQASDSIPRSKMWDHPCKNQMPTHMLSIFEHLYTNADEYALLNGDKSASVQASFGVFQLDNVVSFNLYKEGAPSSPYCFPFTWTTLAAWMMGCRMRSLVSSVK